MQMNTQINSINIQFKTLIQKSGGQMGIKKSCNGCTYKDCPWTRYKRKCPCPLCLVKVTCNTPCEDYDKFRDKYEQEHRRQLWEMQRV